MSNPLANLDVLLNSVLSARYLSAVAVVVLAYDHILTIDGEFSVMWGNPEERYTTKLLYALNRYVTEAVVAYVAYVLSGTSSTFDDAACIRFIWMFSVTATVFIAVSEFAIILRVYKTWDRRRHTTYILTIAFLLSISAATVLVVISTLQVQPLIHYQPLVHTCAFFDIPKPLPYLLGSLLLFDVFLISLALYNALDTPRRTNADVITRLQRDGSRLFIILFVLRGVELLMSVVGNPADCFAVICVVWALRSTIVSRLHLRVEGLRLWGAQQSFLVM